MSIDFSHTSLIRPTEDFDETPYHLGFFSIGYEHRSRFIASRLERKTDRLCGLEYANSRGGAFDENKRWVAGTSTHAIPALDYRLDRQKRFRTQIEAAILESRPSGLAQRIWIDVSSMDRSLMARMLYTLMEALRPPFLLRVLYTPASFVEPNFTFNPILDCSPAIPELSGTLGRPEREIKLLLGLGYEFGVALGLIQQIEPDIAFAFIPKSADKRYEPAVAKANFSFEFGTEQVRLVDYMVNQPVITFDRLLALTSDVSPSRSVIIVPNGPKIFAAISILVGLLRKPYISILRASQSNGAPPHEVQASGDVVAMDFVAE